MSIVQRFAGLRAQTQLLGVGGLVVVAAVVLGVLVMAPSRFGPLLLLGALGLALVLLGLSRPVFASVLLLLSTFFRVAIPTGTLPVDPFLLAFVGVLVSMWFWSASRRRPLALVELDPIACAICLYVAWNVISMVLPHPYAAGAPLDPQPFSVQRFILIGVVIPLTMFLVGRRIFVTDSAIRVLLWVLVGCAGYSALTSILQFSAPALVWPRYIVENTYWPGRAVGVFNQPEVNGLVLVTGFLAAILIASFSAERAAARIVAGVVGAASVYGVYLTHTRAVWLSLVVVVLLGTLVARGFRRGFLITFAAIAAGVAVGWKTLTSSNRGAGGVGSVSEVQDRLNTLATSFWAFHQRPLTGWGVGRFAAVNTYHHQRYSADIPWARGYGIPSHLDTLGILVELGLVGLAFWLVALVLIYARLVRAVQSLPEPGMYGRSFAVIALLGLVAQTATGLTVDLRYFDFPNIVVMMMGGAALGRMREQRPVPRAWPLVGSHAPGVRALHEPSSGPGRL